MSGRGSLTLDVAALMVATAAAGISVFAVTRTEFPRRTAVFTAQVEALNALDSSIELEVRSRLKSLDEGHDSGSVAEIAAATSAMRRFEVVTQERYHSDVQDLQSLVTLLDEHTRKQNGRGAVATSKNIEDLLAALERRFAEQTVKEYSR